MKIIFCQSLGNIDHSTLQSYPWYFGEIDREAATSILEQNKTVSVFVSTHYNVNVTGLKFGGPGNHVGALTNFICKNLAL